MIKKIIKIQIKKAFSNLSNWRQICFVNQETLEMLGHNALLSAWLDPDTVVKLPLEGIATRTAMII